MDDTIKYFYDYIDDGNKNTINALKRIPKFQRLWNGDDSDFRDDDHPEGNTSCADMAFVTFLAGKGLDDKAIEIWFRKSPRYRDKWERQDYRDLTISKAREYVATSNPTVEGVPDEVEEIDEPDIPPNLPMSFWESSQILSEIRAYALYKLCSPDAVLGALFTKIAANLDRSTAIRTRSDNKTSPNFFAGLVGLSNGGKSTAARCAGDMLNLMPSNTPFELKGQRKECPKKSIGTGQGMAESFMALVKKNGAKKATKEQVLHNMLFVADEGGQLLSLLEDSKNKDLPSTICSAWMGEQLGRANASEETTRYVIDYRMGICLNLLPEHIDAIARHSSMGLLSRFAFYSVAYPGDAGIYGNYAVKPQVEWRSLGGTDAPGIFDTQLVQERVESLNMRVKPGTDRKHYLLMQLKMSFLLMYLEGRDTISEHDWSRAEVMYETSCGVRDYAMRVAESVRDAENRELGNLYGVRQQLIKTTDARVAKLAERIRTYITGNPKATKRQVRDACTNAKRGERPLFADAYAMAKTLH